MLAKRPFLLQFLRLDVILGRDNVAEGPPGSAQNECSRVSKLKLSSSDTKSKGKQHPKQSALFSQENRASGCWFGCSGLPHKLRFGIRDSMSGASSGT